MSHRNLVGPRVREARIRHVPRLTQAELAAKLQVVGFEIERAGVSKIESQLREVNDRELVALAKVLNVSVSSLLPES